MARERVPAFSISLLARSSFCFVRSSTSPNLPNSVFTAPRSSHISLVRFSTARLRNPICRLERKADTVVGPVMTTRYSR